MKKILTTWAIWLLATTLQAQQPIGVMHSGQHTGQATFPITTYQELPNLTATDSTRWQGVSALDASWASACTRYAKEEPFAGRKQQSITLDAWKGERAVSQFVVWGTRSAADLHFEVSPLKHSPSRYTLPGENFLTGFVHYVMTDELNKDKKGGCGYRKAADFGSTLVADPNFKVSLAGSLHEELIGELDDYCVALRMKYTDKMLSQRKREGKTTTFYTSCEEPRPHTFIFCNPADSLWFGWYAAKAHLDGYLRWALNSWVFEPLLGNRFHTWAAGDTYLIYPGGRTSHRFEQMIQGIQTYEQIRLIRQEYRRNPKALQLIDRALEKTDEITLLAPPSSEAIATVRRQFQTLRF